MKDDGWVRVFVYDAMGEMATGLDLKACRVWYTRYEIRLFQAYQW